MVLFKNNLNYNLILIPIVWTLVEYIKSYGLLAFPWISVANSQANYLYLIQISNLQVFMVLHLDNINKCCFVFIVEENINK